MLLISILSCAKTTQKLHGLSYLTQRRACFRVFLDLSLVLLLDDESEAWSEV